MRRRGLLMTLGTLLFLGAGAAGMWLLMQGPAPPQRRPLVEPGKLVRLMTVTPQDVELIVQGFGSVRAKTEWSVVPEVSGALVHVAPQLRAGLHVQHNELLFEIDPRPYHLAVQRIQAQVAQLREEIVVLRQQRQNEQANLELAQRNLAIADEQLRRDEALLRRGTISARERDSRQQWRNQYMSAVQAATNSLALIGPQIAKTEAAIAVAQAQLGDATLQLQKTRVAAPFDGQVVRSRLDPGEYVQAGQEVATLYDTAAVELPVAVPLAELRWLPALTPDTLRRHEDNKTVSASLPPARVFWHSHDREYTWEGRLVRWEAGLDTQTRTLTLVVEVPQPWQAFRPGEHPPLQPGMFCRVEIAATTIRNAVVIPRHALREGDVVFLERQGALVIQPVQVLRLQREEAIVAAGLQSGDRVVLSPLPAPVEGMKLRSLAVEPSPASARATEQTDAAMLAAERRRRGQEAP